MRKQQPQSIEQYVIPPDGGIITRFPSNQTFRRNYSGLAVASNVRAAAGRLYNAPGYEEVSIYPAIDTSPLLIADVELVQGRFHILGDCDNLYALNESGAFILNPSLGGAGLPGPVVAGLSYTFSSAVAVTSEGAALAVTWSLLSGPGTASFANLHAVNTTVTVSAPGLYVFQISATDGVTTATASGSVRFLTCTASPGSYAFPTTSGGTLDLVGLILGVSAPSNPYSDGSSYVWRNVSGPATVEFSDPSALSPVAIVPATPGEYVVELTVSAGETSYSSQATITVPEFNYTIVMKQWNFTYNPVDDPEGYATYFASSTTMISIDGADPVPMVYNTVYQFVKSLVITTADVQKYNAFSNSPAGTRQFLIVKTGGGLAAIAPGSSINQSITGRSNYANCPVSLQLQGAPEGPLRVDVMGGAAGTVVTANQNVPIPSGSASSDEIALSTFQGFQFQLFPATTASSEAVLTLNLD